MKKISVMVVFFLTFSFVVEAKRLSLFSTPYRKEKIKKAIRWGKNTAVFDTRKRRLL